MVLYRQADMQTHFCFQIGQPVHHKIFDYRGVVVESDPMFSQSEIWYELMTRTKPPKDVPWYYILVDNSEYTCYVCEKNLEPDLTGKAIHNPALGLYFSRLEQGLYRRD